MYAIYMLPSRVQRQRHAAEREMEALVHAFLHVHQLYSILYVILYKCDAWCLQYKCVMRDAYSTCTVYCEVNVR